MKFTDVRVVEETESVMFNVVASKEEVAFLVDYAVNNLLATGVIAIDPLQSEQEVRLNLQ